MITDNMIDKLKLMNLESLDLILQIHFLTELIIFIISHQKYWILNKVFLCEIHYLWCNSFLILLKCGEYTRVFCHSHQRKSWWSLTCWLVTGKDISFFFLVFIVRSKINEAICMSPKQVYFNSFTVIIYGRNLWKPLKWKGIMTEVLLARP